MQRFWPVVLGVMFMAVSVNAAVVTEEINYQSGENALKGYLAFDDAIEGRRPGIIVVHEWWGHNEYARKRARMLAELGYTALAVDMYGEGKNTEHPEDAGSFAAAATENMEEFQAKFNAGYRLLKEHETVDDQSMAAIGYCFGGSTVLNMARAGVDLKGVVSFHGSLNPGVIAEKGNIKAKILVCHGEADTFISEEVIADFKKEMDEVEADYQFNVYAGAKHSFTNPKADEYTETLGIAYDKAADEKSWQDMQDFFTQLFSTQ